MGDIKRVRVGDPITADLFNEIADRLRPLANLNVAQSSGLLLSSGPWGHSLALALPHEIWVQLSGSTSPYDWVEVAPVAGGTWAPFGFRSGTASAYEFNGLGGLGGKVVRVWWTAAGDMRFEYPRFGTCGWKFVVNNCDGTSVVTGALVELRQAGTLIDSCTTTGQVTAVGVFGANRDYTSVPSIAFSGGGGTGAAATPVMMLSGFGSLTRTSGGTGYTDGSYTNGTFSGGGGSGGTFSYSVSGGVVQATMTLTNGGSGYTSPPTPVFNAGPGTGAAATIKLTVKSVTVTAGGHDYTSAPAVTYSGGGGSGTLGNASIAVFCRLTPPAGAYDVTITPPAGSGLDTYTASLTHTCSGGDQVTTVALTVDGSHQCSTCGCPTVPNTLTVSPNGTSTYSDTLIYGAPQGGIPLTAHTWFGQTPFAYNLGGTAYLTFVCADPGFYQLTLERIPSDGGGTETIAQYVASGTNTCVPFYLHTAGSNIEGPIIMG